MATIVFMASFLVLAFVGLLNAGYLLWKHYRHRNQPMVCPLTHDCSKVTESPYAHLLPVRNETLGTLFYVVVLLGMIGTIVFPSLQKWGYLLLSIAAGSGVIFSGILVYIQAKVIKDYCFYCLISALVTLLLFVNSLALVFS